MDNTNNGQVLRLTADEVLDEARSIDSRVIELAAERVAGRKRDQKIQELEASLREYRDG